MKGIHVDPKRRTARAEAGVTWSEFNRETQFHGLATTGGVVSTTGIAGYTLGGGLGWLMGRHGLAIDNLLSAEVVTADGRVRTASRRESPDLFWGLRGGGGNFGIVSSFEFRVHPVGPEITGGLVAYPFSSAPEVLRFYREMTEAEPDELTTYAAFGYLPDGAKMAALAICDCRRPGRPVAATRRLKAFGKPILGAVGPMTYCQLNSMMDASYPRGALNYWKSSFLSELSDDAIRVMTDCYSRCPSPMSGMFLEHFHGAATRVRASDSAFPHRRECHNLLVLAQWMDPADSQRCIGWARETYAAMKPFAAPGRYVNYMSDNEVGDPVAVAYGRNYPRLQRLKRKYDPANVFHINQNVEPLRGPRRR